MVYNPYGGRKRKTSTTLPQIQDDDNLEDRVKANAASRVLEATPTVMPTGNQSAPSIAAQDTIVDSAPKQAALQKALPGLGQQSGIFGGSGMEQPSITQPPAPPPSFDMRMAFNPLDPLSAADVDTLKSPASGKGKATGGQAAEDAWAETGTPSADALQKAIAQSQALIRPWNDPRHATPVNSELPLGGVGSFNLSANQSNPPSDGDDPDGFGAALEKILNDIINQDPTEIARDEAGRAILAARSAAGRGQAGMSGAMLGLQSDIMGKAVKRAEDTVFDRSLEAAKTGVRFENMTKGQRIAVMGWASSARDSGMSEEDIAAFIENTLGMDAGNFGVGGLGTQDAGEYPEAPPPPTAEEAAADSGLGDWGRWAKGLLLTAAITIPTDLLGNIYRGEITTYAEFKAALDWTVSDTLTKHFWDLIWASLQVGAIVAGGE